ncbi:MAG: hypothetical protein K2N80_17175 [Lachnospiraceae bacterium]|nr:hypothetical protein [Lachnospiraceae bacterium]
MNREELLKIAKPILFNTDMVLAIMREKNPKTVTRRTLKGFVPKDAVFGYTMFTPEKSISCRGTFSNGYGEKFFKLPYRRDDILYVRETWGEWETGRYLYKACVKRTSIPNADRLFTWRPSIHMPKKAARLFLKVTDVRVERIKGMRLDDFLREGVDLRPEAFNDPENAYWQARRIFKNIWNNTIKKSDLSLYGWDANPYVWVIEFALIKHE